ncbi:MAG: CRISPR system precrRNA processing endoribonuclease RAMP protein Cas6 [Candidatus Competibacteraceae bacterium]
MDHYASLQCLRLRFRFTVDKPLNLPVYKGSTFHGALGYALKRVAPLLCKELFEPKPTEGNGTIPRPFILRPPPEAQRTYEAGSTISCELLVVGAAINHLSLFICAMDSLGREGIGKQRSPLSLAGVDVLQPNGTEQTIYSAAEQSWRTPPAPATGADLVAARPITDTSSVSLHFQSRLRLQTDNRLVRSAPEFRAFFARLLGRLSMLAWFHHGLALVEETDKGALLEQADAVGICSEKLVWDDWSRYSGRQQAWMKFGGLLGEITYTGELTPFLPYLILGEWLHVGGKTSFGLGQYRIND